MLNHTIYYILTQDLHNNSSDIFKKPIIKGMLELEWAGFIESEIKVF